jgi:hypothetical protein
VGLLYLLFHDYFILRHLTLGPALALPPPPRFFSSAEGLIWRHSSSVSGLTSVRGLLLALLLSSLFWSA